ncbi:FAD binding domain of DNA photolyase-domain-containing protein [Panaeolus papilionaceus]|nr:FAD binding domain of DNA photolyase-domain-containing protein [Panaeolus papilionaceus]
MQKRNFSRFNSQILDKSDDQPSNKRARISNLFSPIKVATKEAAAAADVDPPFKKLLRALDNDVTEGPGSRSVVYWMRMADLRIRDNRALSQASEKAVQQNVPLIVLFLIVPQDYIAHDRSARRIDFTLRNLHVLKACSEKLQELHIPLVVHTCPTRTNVPAFVVEFCEKHGANALFANHEYEVDELRRDIKVVDAFIPKTMRFTLYHDKCVVDPEIVKTKQDKSYTVFSPYHKNWIATFNQNTSRFVEESPLPKPNFEDIRNSELFSSLFTVEIPQSIAGFELDEEHSRRMKDVWPEGETMLEHFLTTKAHVSRLGAVHAVDHNAEKTDKHSRILKYHTERDRTDRDTTSRLSLYLSSGVLSARECARSMMRISKVSQLDTSNSSGGTRWIQEIAWRDFYINILISFPRVSMGRPYQEKFADVVWEAHQDAPSSGPKIDSEILKRWKTGTTGVPIVDAAMRCLNHMGWMHNRVRMITAMYLTKDLMIDWRVGERYFMENLIDGDLASNNGGWQWCASTGVDPCPYFRIFNPYSQSTKADPTGDYIRHWVPELAKLRGPDLYNPSKSTANKLGYPLPIIPHNEARDRALRRFKNPGES